MFAADWVVAVRGIDPAASLRGRYKTERGAAKHIRRAGGMEAFGRSVMATAGFLVTAEPKPGDIGIVRHPVAGPLFAIRTALGWVGKTRRGIACAPFPVIVAWSLENA